MSFDFKHTRVLVAGGTRQSIPAGRMGTPDEVAEVALFLASTHARWINGQVLTVDGGQLLGV